MMPVRSLAIPVLLSSVLSGAFALKCGFCRGPPCNEGPSAWSEVDCTNLCYMVFNETDPRNVFSRECYQRSQAQVPTGFLSINNSVEAGAAPSEFETHIRLQQYDGPRVGVWVCHSDMCNSVDVEGAKKLCEETKPVPASCASGASDIPLGLILGCVVVGLLLAGAIAAVAKFVIAPKWAARKQAEAERAAKERAEKERAEKERVEKERAEKERVEKERAAKERAAKERAAKERAEKEGTEGVSLLDPNEGIKDVSITIK